MAAPSVSLLLMMMKMMLVLSLLTCLKTSTATKVPAMFVFGDSLVDPGNNNDLLFSMAKANFPPNGIDFPYGATGRFCNGGTIVDHLSAMLGLPLIPPFNSPGRHHSRWLQGVNFASAGSGVLNDTGRFYGDLYPMDSQIQNFRRAQRELRQRLGVGADGFMSRSLFLVHTGTNDYLGNYMVPFSDKPMKYGPECYAQFLIQQYTRQLKELYDLGARRFVVAGLGPMGCAPKMIESAGGNSNSCVKGANRLVVQFNAKLDATVQELGKTLPKSRFLYWDAYAPAMDIINNFWRYGFKYPHTACCGFGVRAKGKTTCLPYLQCENRSEYVFWDPYHPTDAFNAIVAKEVYQLLKKKSFLR